MSTYTTGSVTSRDGTIIGYRQLGQGPAVIAVHGGMQAAQNFMKLAGALADAFTVYLPDRRGRGLSGPSGPDYGVRTETEDIAALVQKTGASNLFGLSSGAIIALEAALALSEIRRVAAYEPPLSLNHSTPIGWLQRYDQEIARGELGAAVVTALRGTQTAPPALRVVPRFVLEPLLSLATRHGGDDRPSGDDPGSSRDVPLRAIVPTMHYDVQLVIETEGMLPAFAAIAADVLLMGGSKSPPYLKASLDALSSALPNAERVEFPGFDHVAPDNSGKPERVAQELRSFFAR